jgi:hypothetical protein
LPAKGFSRSSAAAVTRRAIHVHGARAALAQAAAEARIVEPQMVAQGIQQRHLGVGVDCVLLTIDIEDEVPDHETPPGVPIGGTWRADPASPTPSVSCG